jgi:hypothetical protein
LFQAGMKIKYRWTLLNWVWHMTNRLSAMGVPLGAAGVVVTAAVTPVSNKRTKNQEGTSPLSPGIDNKILTITH